MTATLDPTPRAATGARTAAAHVAASNAASECFFAGHAEAVAHACHAMAARFERGGRLLVYGQGAQRSDAAHVVVEFVHPVIVGKRALPTVALPAPDALTTIGRADDMLMLLAAGTPGVVEWRLVADAAARGMLVLSLTGETTPDGGAGVDFHFAVPSRDPLVVQETHEMLYHVLWELVHVFFEHRAVGA